MRTDIKELINEIQEVDQQSTRPLGTAQWMGLNEALRKLSYDLNKPSDQLWIGEALDAKKSPLGYADDQHIFISAASRGGKGTGFLIPNLCRWPGSCIVIDPKGENAAVTARRRGTGSEYTHGMGQEVYILDPFNQVNTDPALKGRFNPLDIIDPNSDFAVDDAGRITNTIIVRENQNDPFWEEAARFVLKGIILHVLSEPSFQEIRNLVTVRRLLMQGDWLSVAKLREAGETKIPSAFGILWEKMRRNPSFNGVVAGAGEQMISMAEKTRSGMLEIARTNTTFLDSPPMQRLLEISDFDLKKLKLSTSGLTLYLVLPETYIEHFRWLRLMVSLAVGEMERIKESPQTGYPTLFMLDEFATLKRMEVIEKAVAQAAGFGVKFFFVVQNLAQLKSEYGDLWETFISNSGLKIFFHVQDVFTRNYLVQLLGEQEVIRKTYSGSQTKSQGKSTTQGHSKTENSGTSTTQTEGKSTSWRSSFGFRPWYRGFFHPDTDLQKGNQQGESKTQTSGQSETDTVSESISGTDSTTNGWNYTVHKRPLLSSDEIGRFLAPILKEDRPHPAYPGLTVSLMPGRDPLITRRVNYYESPHFEGLFDSNPSPRHALPPTLQDPAQQAAFSTFPKKTRSFQFSNITWKAWVVIGFILFILSTFIRSVVDSYHSINPSTPRTSSESQENKNLPSPSYLGQFTRNAVVNAIQLNVRAGPGSSYGKIGEPLHRGVIVRVIRDAENGWKEIEVSDLSGKILRGFVNGKLLTPSN